jgi:hypothetical protein
MKTPWRFLRDLTSRGRSEPAPSSNGDTVDESPDKNRTPAALPASEQAILLIDDQAPKNAEARTPAKLAPLVQPSARQPVASNARQEQEPQTKTNRDQATSPPIAVPETNLSVVEQTDAQRLDAEITSLRLALAEKLREQNSQLRKMLDRYGRT